MSLWSVDAASDLPHRIKVSALTIVRACGMHHVFSYRSLPGQGRGKDISACVLPNAQASQAKGWRMKVLTLFELKNQVAQLPPQEAKEVLRRAGVYISRETFDQCQACGHQTLGGKKYCNKACKQKAWRTRRRIPQIPAKTRTGSPRTNAPQIFDPKYGGKPNEFKFKALNYSSLMCAQAKHNETEKAYRTKLRNSCNASPGKSPYQ